MHIRNARMAGADTMASPASGRRGQRAILPFIGAALVLALASAAWVESDLYRYAAALLALAGLVEWARDGFRPAPSWMAVLCMAFALYVGLRMAYTGYAHPENTGGSAEGIYFFPALYPAIGMVLFHLRRQMAAIAMLFVAVSLLLLVASVDPLVAVSGERAAFLYHNNPIHAATGGGFIALAAICFGLYAATGRELSRPQRLLGALAGAATAVLALIGVFGAQSKGVWIAVATALPVMGALVLYYEERFAARLVLSAALLSVFAATLVFRETVIDVIGPSVTGLFAIADALLSGNGLATPIIAGHVPDNFSDRLMLWVNAAEIWSANIAFGTGIYWENLWEETRYADVGYQLIHNGFLEIGMRYGVFGLLFFALVTVWSLVQAHKALGAGLIDRTVFIFYVSATLFFLIAILTNSSNRLAIGESFMLMAGGFGFCCYRMCDPIWSKPLPPRGRH
ncbi:O-antigen ligase family protein [Pararhizobium haloflavum]|uniref:O-antigen ligase family protein n=1 Tax=Pararhizobium haloflavum TaxID=2037914 RepID=UPI0012FFE5B1|nr:O-antigen ligase family protein [Pararhizobium haloflavum]